jgi:hypothetical protein
MIPILTKANRGCNQKPRRRALRWDLIGSKHQRFLRKRKIYRGLISIHPWRRLTRSMRLSLMTTSRSIYTLKDSSRTPLHHPSPRRLSSPWSTHRCLSHPQTKTLSLLSGERLPWKSLLCLKWTQTKATSSSPLRQTVESMWIVMSSSLSQGEMVMILIKGDKITETPVI